MNHVSDAQRRRDDLADLQKMLVKISSQKPKRAAPARPIRRPSQAEVDLARLKLLDATAPTRTNHPWQELTPGEGCLTCPAGSLFRNSAAHHLFLIQEEP
jgi:hypothetical protein